MPKHQNALEYKRLSKNQLVFNPKSGGYSRILYISSDTGEIWHIEMKKGINAPRKSNIQFILREVDSGKLKFTDDPKPVMQEHNDAAVEAASSKNAARRDRAWDLIKGIAIKEPDIFDPVKRRLMVDSVSRESGTSASTILRYLGAYWRGGKTKNALLPNYSQVGHRRDYKSGHYKPLGRPYKDGSMSKVLNARDFDAFESAIKKYYHSSNRMSFSETYNNMIKDSYSSHNNYNSLQNNGIQDEHEYPLQKNDIEEERGHIPSDSSSGRPAAGTIQATPTVPTITQFRYWYKNKYLRNGKQNQSYLINSKQHPSNNQDVEQNANANANTNTNTNTNTNANANANTNSNYNTNNASASLLDRQYNEAEYNEVRYNENEARYNVDRYSNQNFENPSSNLIENQQGINRPGQAFRIYAVTGLISLHSIINSAVSMGQPVIYFAMDAWSNIVTGIHVSLNKPSWQEAVLSIINAAEDKVTYCRRYGIDIDDSQWPCHHVPLSIAAAPEDMDPYVMNKLLGKLYINIANIFPHSGNSDADQGAKALLDIIGHYFNLISLDVKELLSTHGNGVLKHSEHSIIHDQRNNNQRSNQRSKRAFDSIFDNNSIIEGTFNDNSILDSTLDICQFTSIIIKCVLTYNNYHYMKGYTRQLPMQNVRIRPIPREIWNFGISNPAAPFHSIDHERIERLKACLLPAGKAILSETGIIFKGMRYICKDTKLFKAALKAAQQATQQTQYGSYDIIPSGTPNIISGGISANTTILYDPRDVSTIYLCDTYDTNNDRQFRQFKQFKLLEYVLSGEYAEYKGKPLVEIEMLQAFEQYESKACLQAEKDANDKLKAYINKLVSNIASVSNAGISDINKIETSISNEKPADNGRVINTEIKEAPGLQHSALDEEEGNRNNSNNPKRVDDKDRNERGKNKDSKKLQKDVNKKNDRTGKINKDNSAKNSSINRKHHTNVSQPLMNTLTGGNLASTKEFLGKLLGKKQE